MVAVGGFENLVMYMGIEQISKYIEGQRRLVFRVLEEGVTMRREENGNEDSYVRLVLEVSV